MTDAHLEDVKRQFVGGIQQVPPMYSALKHQGVKLLSLAREGIEVQREPRVVEISRQESVYAYLLGDFHIDI